MATKAKNGNGKATASKTPPKEETAEEEGDGQVRFSKGRAAKRFVKLAAMVQAFSDIVSARWEGEVTGKPELLEHLSTCAELLTAGIPLCDALPGPGSSAGAMPVDVDDVCVWSEKHADAYSFLGADSFKVVAIHGEGRGMRIEIKGKNSEGKTFQAIVLRSHVERQPEA